VSAQAGWYPDPGGGQGLYRYWDGRVWSAAVTSNPAAPAPAASLGIPIPPSTPSSGALAPGQEIARDPQAAYGTTSGQGSVGAGQGWSGGQGSAGRAPGSGYRPGPGAGSDPGTGPGAGAGPGTFGPGAGRGQAYADFQSTQRRRSPIGWWLGAAALLVVIVLVAVFVVRGLGGGGLTGNPGGGQGSQDACPAPQTESQSPLPPPRDGRVHGGPVSYPALGSPWEAPTTEDRVPFGTDVASQIVTVEPNYAPQGQSWVASVLVGELQAGDGFYTPQQGSQIVVKCILGAFYGDAEVQSDVKVNRAAAIDGHDGWLVESQLSFDIPGLRTKGELLIVAIVTTGSTAGLFYASIPDTTPQLVQPARDALRNLRVDG
jgi:hypothetical protein